MNDAGRAQQIVTEALRAARDRHVTEITFVYEGSRYTVTDLRRLQAAGQLDTLPRPLAAGAPYMLQEVDLAERTGDRRIQFVVQTGNLGWVAFMPMECDVLLPEGWERIPGKAYLFPEEDE